MGRHQQLWGEQQHQQQAIKVSGADIMLVARRVVEKIAVLEEGLWHKMLQGLQDKPLMAQGELGPR